VSSLFSLSAEADGASFGSSART
jgi:hypothetical protein